MGVVKSSKSLCVSMTARMHQEHPMKGEGECNSVFSQYNGEILTCLPSDTGIIAFLLLTTARA